MVNILPHRKTLISPQQHLRLITNNLNSTNSKNQILACIALTKIKKKVVSPVERRDKPAMTNCMERMDDMQRDNH